MSQNNNNDSAHAPVAVLGAGSWGTALAIQFARAGHPTRLWTRNLADAEVLSLDAWRRRPLRSKILENTARLADSLL